MQTASLLLAALITRHQSSTRSLITASMRVARAAEDATLTTERNACLDRIDAIAHAAHAAPAGQAGLAHPRSRTACGASHRDER